MRTNKTKRTTLSRSNQRILEDFIANNWQRIEAEKWTQDKVAASVAEQLGDGIKITNRHVAAAARVVGKEWRRVSSSNSKKRANSVLRTRVLLYTADIVVQLAKQLGIAKGEQFTIAELETAALELFNIVLTNNGLRKENRQPITKPDNIR